MDDETTGGTMHGKRRGTLVAVAIAVLVAGTSPPPADAAPGASALALTGSGTLSPGMTINGSPQTWAMSASAVGAIAGVMFADGPVFDCYFMGHSSGPFAYETPAIGSGILYGSCVAPAYPEPTWSAFTCALDYLRQGNTWRLTGACEASVGGTVSTQLVAGWLQLMPNTVWPVTSYILTGTLTGPGV